MYVLSFLPDKFLKPFYFQAERMWCKLFVKALNTNLHVCQKYIGKLPKQFIVIANHPSAFEDVGIVATFNAYPVAKSGVGKWFMVGRINKKSGTIFVKRTSVEGRRAAYKEIVHRLKQGDSIAMYPEGGCKGRRLNKFMSGAFRASVETGVPILPVYIHYRAQEAFEWQGQTLIRKMWEIITAPNHNADYYVYDPIYPNNYIDTAKIQSIGCNTLSEDGTIPPEVIRLAANTLKQGVHVKYLKWQEKYLD